MLLVSHMEMVTQTHSITLTTPNEHHNNCNCPAYNIWLVMVHSGHDQTRSNDSILVRGKAAPIILGTSHLHGTYIGFWPSFKRGLDQTWSHSFEKLLSTSEMSHSQHPTTLTFSFRLVITQYTIHTKYTSMALHNISLNWTHVNI